MRGGRGGEGYVEQRVSTLVRLSRRFRAQGSESAQVLARKSDVIAWHVSVHAICTCQNRHFKKFLHHIRKVGVLCALPMGSVAP